MDDQYKEKIAKIENDIGVIKNNHLAHIESSIGRIEKTMDKMDNRLWAIVAIILAAAVASMFT